MNGKSLLVLFLVGLALSLALSACGQAAEPQTEQPDSRSTFVAQVDGSGPDATASPEVVTTRTPLVTSTPGPVTEGVTEVIEATGLENVDFLGLLSAEDLINLGISLLLILAGYVVSVWVTRVLLRWITNRTSTAFGPVLIDAVGSQIKWLLLIPVLYFATARLTFVDAGLKRLLFDIYFVLALFIIARLIWRLIDLSHVWYQERIDDGERSEELDPVLVLLTRSGRIVLVLLVFSILLSHFGISVIGLATAMGIIGLAISLAARDTVSDIISGFIILSDQPYRRKDRIEIQEIQTWGDVTDIGIRTTSVRTPDNRMVIVPNSIIGRNQIVNYTYPDTRYRIETQVRVAYSSDFEAVRHLFVDAVRQVEGVLPDKPVEALYVELGDSAMIMLVRWWIESYEDTRVMLDRVNSAIKHAMNEQRVDVPLPAQMLDVHIAPEMSSLPSN